MIESSHPEKGKSCNLQSLLREEEQLLLRGDDGRKCHVLGRRKLP